MSKPHHHHHHHQQQQQQQQQQQAKRSTREGRSYPATLLNVTGKESKLPGSTSSFWGSCRSVEDFEKGNRVGEGTYGVVYRVADAQDGLQYAVKRIRMDNDSDGFPIPSIREVSLLRKLRHRNVVRVKEVVVGDTLDKTYMLMEFADTDLAALLDRQPAPLGDAEVKCLIRQLVEGVAYLHNNFVMHRDLKLANLLLNKDGVLKIARKFAVPLKPLTPNVVTLWYRAPELLLGERTYSVAVDNWSIGCIFGELLLNKPLLPGKVELEQLTLICDLIGVPTEKTWPDWHTLPLANMLNVVHPRPSQLRHRFPAISRDAFDLLQCFLTYNPSARITCPQALSKPYLANVNGESNVLILNPHIRSQMRERLSLPQTAKSGPEIWQGWWRSDN
ncbi:hypothetical protein RI367_000710 [Sorochytrium milnesiophthora]